MKRRVAILFTMALLALGLWSMAALRADDDDDKKAIKEAQEAVLKLVDAMNGKGGNAKEQIAAIKKKFDELKPIMWVYKPRKKNGIGMGKDGAEDIEQAINKLGSNTSKIRLTPQKIAAMKADLIKACEMSKAIAEVSDLYAQQYAKKDVAKWKGYTKEMRKGADQLLEAVKKGEAASVKKAAYNLGNSCTSCHSEFRE